MTFSASAVVLAELLPGKVSDISSLVTNSNKGMGAGTGPPIYCFDEASTRKNGFLHLIQLSCRAKYRNVVVDYG